MNTTFSLLPSADAARPASACPAGVRLTAYAAVACVADSGDELLCSRGIRSYSGRTCCSSDNLSSSGLAPSPAWRRRVPRYLLTSQSWSGRGFRRKPWASSAEYLQGCSPSSQSASGGSCRILVEGTTKLYPRAGGPKSPPC